MKWRQVHSVSKEIRVRDDKDSIKKSFQKKKELILEEKSVNFVISKLEWISLV